MYALLGALVSGTGIILPIHQFQNLFSFAFGFMLIWAGLSGIYKIRIPGMSVGLRRLSEFLKQSFARQLRKKNRLSILLLGGLNGLLPCGLTSVALTLCLMLRGPIDGFSFMLLFGAGTLPAMLGFTGVVNWVAKKKRWSAKTVTTALLIVSGCALILRAFVMRTPVSSYSTSGLTDILCR